MNKVFLLCPGVLFTTLGYQKFPGNLLEERTGKWCGHRCASQHICCQTQRLRFLYRRSDRQSNKPGL
jgi:hypothetical protein